MTHIYNKNYKIFFGYSLSRIATQNGIKQQQQPNRKNQITPTTTNLTTPTYQGQRRFSAYQ